MSRQKKKKNQAFQKFLRFSGIGVQLGALMYFASLVGKKADAYFAFQKPWCTLFFLVLALFVFLVQLIRQLHKLNN